MSHNLLSVDMVTVSKKNKYALGSKLEKKFNFL